MLFSTSQHVSILLLSFSLSFTYFIFLFHCPFATSNFLFPYLLFCYLPEGEERFESSEAGHLSSCGLPKPWGGLASTFWHSKLLREWAAFKQQQSHHSLWQANKDNRPPKLELSDQGTELEKAFTHLSSYPQEESHRRAPGLTASPSPAWREARCAPAPLLPSSLQCFWDPRSCPRPIPAIPQLLCWSCRFPAFRPHLSLLLQAATSGSHSDVHRAMSISLLPWGNPPWKS